MQSAHLNVALVKRLPRSLGVLTYTLYAEEDPRSLVGRWVRVPFRGSMVDGIVWSVAERPLRALTLRPVHTILGYPVWGKERRDFAEWFARVHWISLSHTLAVMIPDRPKSMKQGSAAEISPVQPSGHLRIQQRRGKEIASAVDVLLNPGKEGQKQFFPLGTFAERVVAMLHICSTVPTQQVCILVPTREELSRCSTALARTLGPRLLVLDSTLPSGTYWEAWNRVARQSDAVVITTKRGIFAPFQSVGAVVVDRETDRHHRQSDMNPRYDAREIAARIAERQHAALLLLDAVPTLRSFHDKTIVQKTFSLQNGHRYVVDRLLEPRGGYGDLLAPCVVDAVNNTTSVVLFFLNRRGTARSVYCSDCGWTAVCPSCGLATTVANEQLSCDRCKIILAIPLQCGRCKNVKLKMRGMGVQRFAGALKKLFPNRSVCVLEDSANNQSPTSDDLVVTTEKVFTSSALPQIGLTVFPEIDNLLRFPGYATYEFVYCLCERVCTLAGSDTDVFMQTRDPEHPVLRSLRKRLPALLYNEEQITRSSLRLPPAVDIFTLTNKGKNHSRIEKQKKLLLDSLRGDVVVAKELIIEELVSTEAYRGKRGPRAVLVLRCLSGTPSFATLERVHAHLPDAWIVERNPESLTI